MDLERYFTAADREAIEAAVKEVELTTAGEIVPFAVGRSDHYATASWKGALSGALLFSALAAAVSEMRPFWGVLLPLWIALPPALGALCGFLLTLALPPLRRWLIPPEVIELRVRQRALTAFVEQEVFRTRERTGILIFLSLFEHRVLVIGDTGINAGVEPRQWEEVAAAVADGVKLGRPGPALAVGIRRCAELLASRIVRRPADEDELGNALRTSEE
jgi:putative membrane protein